MKNIKYYLIAFLSFIAILSMPQIVNADWSGANGGSCVSSCLSFERAWKSFGQGKNASTPITRYSTNADGSVSIVNDTLGNYVNSLVKYGMWSSTEASVFWSSKNTWLMADKNGNLYNLDSSSREGDVFEGLSAQDSKNIINHLKNSKSGWITKGMGVFGVDDYIENGKFNGTDGDSKYNKNEKNGNNVSCYVGSGEIEKSVGKTEENSEITGDYSVFMKITPVKPSNFENMTPTEQENWSNTHKEQITKPILTEFGQYIKDHKDEITAKINSSSSTSDWNNFINTLKELNAKPLNLDKLELSEENLKGFQSGGAYTITTFSKQATVSAVNKTDKIDVYDCVKKKGSDGITKTYYEKVSSKSGSTSTSDVKFKINANGYSPKKSYQIINVRCNVTQFKELIKNTKSTENSAGSGLGSSSAVSPIVNDKIATFYNELTKEFFYDGKDCEDKLRCSANNNTTAQNDSVNNVQDRGDNSKNYGAQSNGKSSDSFTFFRDNQSNAVRNDVWYPSLGQYENDFSYNKDNAANATIITLDPKGTPINELFNLEDDKNNVILTGNQLALNDNSIVVPNQLNVLNWRASWASDKGKEQKVNIRYGYKVPVKVSIPTLGVDGIEVNRVSDTETLNLSCISAYDTTDEQEPEVSNSLDTEFKPIKTFIDKGLNYYKVGFIKSSAE